MEQSSDPIVCNICVNKMAICKQVSFLSGKFFGSVDLSTGCETDNVEEATSVLIILAVCVHGFLENFNECIEGLKYEPILNHLKDNSFYKAQEKHTT